MTRTITLDHLRDRGACRDSLDRFRRLHGVSVEVSEEVGALWGEQADWAARYLLSEEAEERMCREVGPSFKAHRERHQAIWEEFKYCDYSETPKYMDRLLASRRQYETELGRAFARAYISDTRPLPEVSDCAGGEEP